MTHAQAQVVAAGDKGFVVALRWRSAGAEADHQRYQALKLRDGLIFDMQDYLRERDARRAIDVPS